MASKSRIMSAIAAMVGTTSCRSWRIGLKNDPSGRKTYWQDSEKQNVGVWSQWSADSLSDAEEIEAHFISKGMKGDAGGDLTTRQAVYVYIF